MTRVGLLLVGHVDPKSQHIGGDYPELYGAILEPLGVELVTFRCDEGDLPASLNDVDGFLCSPSRLSVYDDVSWLRDVEELLRRLVAEEKPYVGICFGHQLLAQALGGEVRKADVGWGVGVKEYAFTMRPWWMDPPASSLRLIASHQDQVMRVPDGATVFAHADYCPNAGMLVGERAWTIQTHPEFTAALADHLYAGRVELLGADTVDAARLSLQGTIDQALAAEWIARFFASAI